MKHFYSSFIITFLGLVAAFWLGGFSAVYICALLAVLEVSLSFDNAVVNAKTLREMSPEWQRRFIVFGIPIAVFGMRLLFPLLIVALASGVGFVAALEIALNDATRYHEILKTCEDKIYVFGGGFLLVVFFEWFFEKREVSWLTLLEENALTKLLKKSEQTALLCALLVGLGLVLATKNATYALCYFGAVCTHALITIFSDICSGANGVRNGLAGFLYLEVLDASFSFDGVIGAFALSSDIFVIAIGLGVGAMFVRSLTLYFVEKGTLSEFAFLEHGAHYAIFALGLIMLLKLRFEVSELVTGTIGLGFIAVAFFCSLLKNRSNLEKQK